MRHQVNMRKFQKVVVHMRNGEPSFVDKYMNLNKGYMYFKYHKKVKLDDILTVKEFTP